jgi:hypothetical protein
MAAPPRALPPAPRLKRLRELSRCLVRAPGATAPGRGGEQEEAPPLVELSPIDHVICPATLYQVGSYAAAQRGGARLR